MKRSIGTHDAYDKNDYRTKRSDGTLNHLFYSVTQEMFLRNMEAFRLLLNSEQNPEECDATDDDSSIKGNGC